MKCEQRDETFSQARNRRQEFETLLFYAAHRSDVWVCVGRVQSTMRWQHFSSDFYENIYIFIARERLTSFALIDKMRHGKSLHSWAELFSDVDVQRFNCCATDENNICIEWVELVLFFNAKKRISVRYMFAYGKSWYRREIVCANRQHATPHKILTIKCNYYIVRKSDGRTLRAKIHSHSPFSLMNKFSVDFRDFRLHILLFHLSRASAWAFFYDTFKYKHE